MASQEQIKQYVSDLERLQEMHEPIEIFGGTLRDIAEQSEFRQIDIAKALPVDESTVSKWMTGVQLPVIETLDSLLKALAVSAVDETYLRFAYNWDRWMRDVCHVIQKTKEFVENKGHSMTTNELQYAYHEKLLVIRSLLAPYETYKERNQRLEEKEVSLP